MDKEIKQQIIEYARLMDEKGMGSSYEGNISAKKDGLIYITPTHKRKSALREDMIAVIDEKGVQVEGTCKPSSELLLHAAAYEFRKDVCAVIHSHAPYLTAYAICHKPVETYAYPEALALFKKIPVAPYGRPGTSGIYQGVKQLILEYDCILLANHGSLTVAASLDIAFGKLEAAEGVARILSIVRSVGEPVMLPQGEIDYLSSLVIKD